MSKVLTTEVQIRFADGDTLGHINNISLQHYFDLGKMEFYSKVMHKTIEADSESLILVSTSANYFAQSHLFSKLKVETQVEKIGTNSVTFYQRLIDEQTGAVNADCRTVAVAFDFEIQKSFELKPEWRKAMEEYLVE